MENLLKERTHLKTKHVARFKELETLLSGQRKQLMGAVRRIHYLVSELKVSKRGSSEKDKYILRLEKKLLQMNNERGGPARRIEIVQKSGEAPKSPQKSKEEKPSRLETVVREHFRKANPVLSPHRGRHGLGETDGSFTLSPLQVNDDMDATVPFTETSPTDKKFHAWLSSNSKSSSSGNDTSTGQASEAGPSESELEKSINEEVERAKTSGSPAAQAGNISWLRRIGAR